MSHPIFQELGFVSIKMANKADWTQLNKHWSVVSLNFAGYCFTTNPYHINTHTTLIIYIYILLYYWRIYNWFPTPLEYIIVSKGKEYSIGWVFIVIYFRWCQLSTIKKMFGFGLFNHLYITISLKIKKIR